MEIILIWGLCGLAAFGIANSKGRSGCGWGVLGLIFGPLALLGAAVMSADQKKAESKEQRAGLQSGKLRRCPHCAEPINKEAVKCRYCGSDVAPLPPPRGILSEVIDAVKDRRR